MHPLAGLALSLGLLLAGLLAASVLRAPTFLPASPWELVHAFGLHGSITPIQDVFVVEPSLLKEVPARHPVSTDPYDVFPNATAPGATLTRAKRFVVPPPRPVRESPNGLGVLVRAWRGLPHEYPEISYIRHATTPSGVAFSGGGSRSFSSTLGYLRALLDANLLKRTRYISSVSGGTWAVAGFVYHDPAVTGTNLKQYLGEPTRPEDITLLGSAKPPRPGCARGFPVRRDLVQEVAMELIVRRTDPSDVWVKAVHRVFLEPAGIPLRGIQAYSRTELARVLARNPDLAGHYSFVLPCGGKEPCEDRPFHLINTAMLGPIEAAPFGLTSRRYVMMEATPLYTGFPQPMNVTYPGTEVTVGLGGLVEPLGFGAPTQEDFCGFHACPIQSTTARTSSEETYDVRVPSLVYPFGLANATAASSWAPGSLVAEQHLLQPLENILLSAPYYSPMYGGASRELFLGDGADMENQGVLALLRRGIDRVVVYVNTPIPLATKQQYNPYLWIPRADTDVDSSLLALFGVRTMIPPLGMDFSHAQVFSQLSFPRVMRGMQRAQRKGNGAVASFTIRTVANKWWGIAAGRRVRITFVYLGRVYEWENRLEAGVAAQVAPNKGLLNPGKLPTNGTFKDFPHPSVARMRLSASMSNMLADLAHWVGTKNKPQIAQTLVGRRSLTGESLPDENQEGSDWDEEEGEPPVWARIQATTLYGVV